MSAQNHRSLHNQRLHFRLGLEFRFYTSRRHGWERNRINGRRLGTARPFPLWRLHSGLQSSSVDQYSETPPEHLASTLAEATRRSVVTRNCLSKFMCTREAGVRRVPSALLRSRVRGKR